MTDSRYRHLVLVIDRSGSIRAVLDDMQGGLRQFIADREAESGMVRTTVTLVQFNTRYEVVCSFAPLDSPLVRDYRIVPQGGTALLDATGRAVADTGAALAALPEGRRPGKVIVMISTDGLENSSCCYSREQIREMTARQERDYSWTFSYAGANQDAFAEAGALGIGADTVLQGSGTGAGTRNSWMSASSMVGRGMAQGVYAYTEAERDAAAE